MRPKIVACFGVKYEPDWMIDQLKDNLKWVDDFAILDCRDRDELWIHEGDYRLLLREKARKMGADWILITAPDERWEDSAGEKIRPLIDGQPKHPTIYEFDLKELYHPLWYRIDGRYAEKFRRRLYPLYDDQIMCYQPIQCPSTPRGDYKIEHVDVRIYHTKMIEPENRTTRVKVFNKLDPNKKFQDDYDYLDDEVGGMVKRIEEDRMYHPKYKKFIFEVPEKYL